MLSGVNFDNFTLFQLSVGQGGLKFSNRGKELKLIKFSVQNNIEVNEEVNPKVPNPMPSTARPSRSSIKVRAIANIIAPRPKKNDDTMIAMRRPKRRFIQPPIRANTKATPTVIWFFVYETLQNNCVALFFGEIDFRHVRC